MRADRTVAWAAVSVAVAAGLSTAGPARADCQPASPASGATVNCTLIAPTGFQAGVGINALTVNVASGASVFDNGAGAILLNDFNTVTNQGAVIGGIGVAGIGAGDNNTIANINSITVGDFSAGIFVGDNNVVTNIGAVTAGFNGAGIVADDNNAITNIGTITVGRFGVGITALNNNAVVNAGTLTIENFGFGIQVNDSNAVTNTGTITVGRFGVGIGAIDNNAIVNAGTMTIGNLGTGVLIVGINNTVTNAGTLTGGDRVFGIDTSIGSNNTIINNGLIRVGAFGIGINTGDSNLIINNAVIVAGPNGVSIGTCGCVAATNNTVINNGTLDGRINLDSQGGADNVFSNFGLITITDPGTPVGANHLISGIFSQFAGGVLELRVNTAGVSDTLSTSTANLGGALRAIVQPGLYGSSTTYFGVVGATNLITTRFSQVQAFDALDTAPLAFFTAQATYNPFSVDLTLTRLPFGAVPGETRNEQAVGNALEAAYGTNLTGAAATFFSALLQTTSVAVLDHLSGEGTAGTQTVAFDTASMFLAMLMDQGAQWRDFDPAGTGGYAFSTPLSYAPGQALAQAQAFKAMPLKTPIDVDPHWRAWAAGFDGTWLLHGEPDPGSSDLSHRTAGGAAGVDYQVNRDLLFGVAAGGSTSTFAVPDRATSGTVDGAHLGAYGVARLNQWYAAGALTFSAFDNRTRRTITGVGPPELATGSFNSSLFGGRFEIGFKQAFNGFSITPFAAVQATELRQDGYGETSITVNGAPGMLGLTFAPRTISSLPTFLGAQLDTRMTFASGMIWSPYARLSWVHEFEPTRDVAASLMAVPGVAFTVDGPRAAADALRIDVGEKLAIARNAALFASFDGEFSDRGQMYAGKGGVKLSW